ncbi:mRNA-decapping enzyme 1B isoform X2 [Onychomys torridus]|uniref:mRNA-decapping enzyme 1B isoform X2 n=1 Tax=Onychomys torridus TaxID=38674 RepID=UPI00167F288A|nr:mRNA-decapping enzyme 1B isoform X2 [Onychomys torridus]
MAAAAAGGPPGKGHDISLAALRRHDPYISRIVDVASQVALYTFFHRANKWEKTDVEGTLFVYTRSVFSAPDIFVSGPVEYTVVWSYTAYAVRCYAIEIHEDISSCIQKCFSCLPMSPLCDSSWTQSLELLNSCPESCQSSKSASPKHGFTIMNRLSMENRTEPITKDLDFQLQDPFLLYRNATLSIYGIWFYDKEECQRIAKLMKNLTQCEQLKACHGAGAGSSPVNLSSGEGREVDILQMLNKAKDEYTKCKTCSEPKQITSSSAICDNPKLIKPVPVRPSGSQRLQESPPNKTLDPEPHHLSLTALFGKQDKAPCHEILKPSRPFAHHHHHHHHHHYHQQEQLPVHQGVGCFLSSEEPRVLSLPVEKQLCPAIQKLMVGSTGLHPLPRHPEQWPCEGGSPSPTGALLPAPAQLGSPWNGGATHCAQSTGRHHKLFDQLQGASGASHKYKPCAPASLAVATQVAPCQSMARSQLVYFSGPLPSPTPGHQALRKEQCALLAQTLPLSGSQENSPSVLPTQELLRKLQVIHPEQQLQVASRPALAARFPVSAQGSGTEKPLEAWANKTASMEKQAPLMQSTCAPLRETDNGLMPLGSQELPTASSSLLPLQNWEPSTMASSPLTRLQLQEALLHLIQNDDNFLSIIYEAYLFSVTQAAMRKAT